MLVDDSMNETILTMSLSVAAKQRLERVADNSVPRISRTRLAGALVERLLSSLTDDSEVVQMAAGAIEPTHFTTVRAPRQEISAAVPTPPEAGSGEKSPGSV